MPMRHWKMYVCSLPKNDISQRLRSQTASLDRIFEASHHGRTSLSSVNSMKKRRRSCISSTTGRSLWKRQTMRTTLSRVIRALLQRRHLSEARWRPLVLRYQGFYFVYARLENIWTRFAPQTCYDMLTLVVDLLDVAEAVLRVKKSACRCRFYPCGDRERICKFVSPLEKQFSRTLTLIFGPRDADVKI